MNVAALVSQSREAARGTARHFPGVDHRDLEHDAIVACLEARDAFDPDHPGAAGWYRLIANRTIVSAAKRYRSPVSLTEHACRKNVEAMAIRGPDRRHDYGPEAIVSAAQVFARVRALEDAVARAELHAARGLPRYVRDIGAAAGRARYVGMHDDLAVEYGISPRQVVNALGRFVRATKQSREVRILRRQLEQLKEDIRR